MSWASLARLIIVPCALVLVFAHLWKNQSDSTRATLLVTMVIAALTGVYAVLTFEIVLQNQKMSKAASESASVMERSLRFSHAPNLTFTTLITADPTLTSENNVTVYKNEDYLRACKDAPASGQSVEFVFAVVKNVGKGAATKVHLTARYDVTETTNPNFKFSVSRGASVALLEPDRSLALIIHVARVPSVEDGVELMSATLSCGDFYRDALGEAPQEHSFTAANNSVQVNAGCKLAVK
jgi:hypothetical protein